MNAYGIAPFSRIHATATVVSRPPENAIPTRSPTGSDVRTCDTRRPGYRTFATARASSSTEKAPSSLVRMMPSRSTTNVNGSVGSRHCETH